MTRKPSAIEKLQNPEVLELIREKRKYEQEENERRLKEEREGYIYQKLTLTDKIRRKLSDIKVLAACIIDDVYDAEFIMDNGKVDDKLTEDDFQSLIRYAKKVSKPYHEGLPFFKNYVVEREYEYKKKKRE